MKKIFIVAIAVMLCCVMLIPVSAANHDYNGVTLPFYGEIYENFPQIDYSEYNHVVMKSGDSGYTFYVNKNAPYVNGSNIVYTDYYYVYYKNNKWVYGNYVKGENNDYSYTVIWTNKDIKDTTGKVVIDGDKSFYTPPPCDGSTCPATDMNYDNICDDCGVVFAVLRDYPIPDPYLEFTTEYQTRFPYAFIYKGENNVYHMILSSTEPVYFNGAVVVENNDDDLSYLKYSVNGETWKYDGGYSDGVDIVTDTVYPSFNMNDLDGNLAFKQNTDFFPVPLWVEMDNLTQGEMVKLSPTVVGLIATLTVCGIGCLALLVALKLFGKRSLIFRK